MTQPDILYDRLSGLPPEQGERLKAMPDGSFALVGMAVAGFAPLQSLNAVSATGPGLMMDNVGVRNNHAMVVTVSAGFTAGAVAFQGSQDNVNWFTLLTAANTGGTAPPLAASGSFLYTANLTPIRYLRANVTTAITGGTVTVWVASAG